MSRNLLGLAPGSLAAGALALFFLSGCSMFNREPPPPCPAVVAVQDASTLTRFQSGGRDLTDVVFDAAVDDVRYGCEYDGKQAIDISASVILLATRGPANTSGSADFSYFVALANSDRQILAKQVFPVSLPFQGNLTRVRLTDSVQMRIPLTEGQIGTDFRIFVGLEITEDELAYNRSRR